MLNQTNGLPVSKMLPRLTVTVVVNRISLVILPAYSNEGQLSTGMIILVMTVVIIKVNIY